MAEPLRHRQTKEAATDMFSLQPPRHISTLPNCGRDAASPRMVEFVPEAELMHRSKQRSALFDHLVGAGEQRRRHGRGRASWRS